MYWYFALDKKVKPMELTWSIKELASDRFKPMVQYSYKLNDVIYSGSTELHAPVVKSKDGAMKAIEALSKKNWSVWHASKWDGFSSIQRQFPLKGCVYTAILWGLIGYFCWLGYYAERRRLF